MNELNVKVGDKVILRSYCFGAMEDKIATVSKVTPSGRICVKECGDTKFNKYGSQMGTTGSWHRSSLEELTPQKEKEIREKNTIRKCCKAMEETVLSYEKAVQILKILEGE